MSLLDHDGFAGVRSPDPLAPSAPTTLRIPQHLDELLERCLSLGGSDLHLTAGAPPTVRVDGVLQPIEGYGNLHGDMIERLVFSVLNERKIAAFASELELDTSYSKLIAGMAKAKIAIDRKILADLAISDPVAFKKIVEAAQAA